ncbi:MAG: branched-chain amino acid ABC transporter permease [Hyphomicrobiaceae bacterium]|nr:branched-chain amino acid ABC transporter permease [Hyphomicrobiaceae bacterium]
MAGSMRPAGDFRTSYAADRTIFPTRGSWRMLLLGLLVLCILPLQFAGVTLVSSYWLALIIQIAIYAIAALGLNILVGFTGQISLGHAAFFGFGGFASAYLSGKLGVPVALAIPLAGLLTAMLGIIVGLPAARLKGLYLAIATLASQFVLQDFFGRAQWFTGGASGASAEAYSIFGISLSGDRKYFLVVLAHLIIMYLFAANLMRTRDGRAMVAVRDHYLSAEIMGINLTYYRILAFGISSLYAGVGGALMAHYTGFVSSEAFDLLLSINFLAMVIIGGLGSIMGSILGAIFIICLPEVMQSVVRLVQTLGIGQGAAFTEGLAYMKEMAIGLAIVLFLVFEPDGLAARWRKIKAYWKLYPFSY